MWSYLRKYLPLAVLAVLCMVLEVTMDLLQPEIMSRIVDDGVLGLNTNGVGDLTLVWKMGILMACLALIGCLGGSMNNVFTQNTAQRMGNQMRKDCFSRMMRFSFPQIDRFGTGSLVTRVTNDITQVQNMVAQFIRGLVRNFMQMFGSIFFMFYLSRTFGIVVLLAFPVIVGCMALFLWRADPLFARLQAQLDRINSIMQEDVAGIRVIKACVREIYEKIRFGKANDDLIKTQLQVLIIFAFMNPAVNMLMNAVVVLLLYLGAKEVFQGVTSPGNVMAAVTYTTQLLHGILMLVMLFQNISRGLTSWRRVKEILHTDPELADGSFEGETALRGQVEFRDVSFAYPGSSRMVLQHINLTIRPGETVAVMGATGCGKSTLVNLIPRFYDVTEGAVLVDGVDVREYRQEALRARIASVLQKSELFSVSVSENISWGDESASLERIQEAAGIAQAHAFIAAAPNGYDTVVAERGMSLSGGQKQRVSIARAVLKPAEILILDDASSALDLKTEADLYEALRTKRPDMTRIIVAQRIASVRQADRILILEDGRIAATGTHEELLASCKVYQDIYDSQIGEDGERDG